jgi:hypothetical protein
VCACDLVHATCLSMISAKYWCLSECAMLIWRVISMNIVGMNNASWIFWWHWFNIAKKFSFTFARFPRSLLAHAYTNWHNQSSELKLGKNQPPSNTHGVGFNYYPSVGVIKANQTKPGVNGIGNTLATSLWQSLTLESLLSKFLAECSFCCLRRAWK